MENGRVGVKAVHLRVIHAALIAGVCAFAVAIVVIGPLDAGMSTRVLQLVWLGVATGAMLGAGALSGRLAATADAIQRARSAILIWALGEGQALLGLVCYLLTGDRLLLVLPLVTFLLFMARYRPACFTASGESARFPPA